MTSWTRATHSRICGRCGASVRRGDPIFVMVIAAGAYRLTTPKLRCGTCAGPAPSDLPALVEQLPVPIPQAWTQFNTTSLVPVFDYKAAQVGEREPGCDDE